MSEKLLNTRIQLKNDSWTNWSNVSVPGRGGNLVLKAGEVGICQIPAQADNTGKIINKPATLMKVGDGSTAFKDLPWVQGIAADVYDWAKQPKPPAVTATDDKVVILEANGQAIDGKHAKKGPANGYTSGNKNTSVSGYGASTTIKIPQITVDAYGHVTAAKDESVTITMPSAQDIPSGSGEVKPSDNVSVVDLVSLNGHTLSGSTKKFVGARGITINGDAEKITVTGPDLSSYAKTSELPSISVIPDAPIGSEPEGDSVVVLSDISASGHTITQTGVKVPTKQYVDSIVAGAVQYWGVVNKAEDLGKDMTTPSTPAASIGKGDFYRVGKAFSSFKVGDLLIAKANQNSYTAVSNYDRIIQEDYKGTVTSVGIKDGGGLVVSGSPITSSGTITIAHADTSTQESIAEKNRTYIKSVTLDDYGHVTGLSTGTETVKDTNTSHDHEVGKGLSMSGSAGTSGGTVTYSLKASTSNEIGGGKATPYSGAALTGGKNYPVQIGTDDKYFVSVPWDDNTDTNTAHNHTADTGLKVLEGSGSTTNGTVKYGFDPDCVFILNGGTSTVNV